MNLYSGTISGWKNNYEQLVSTCFRVAKTREEAEDSILKDFANLKRMEIKIEKIDPEIVRIWYEKVVLASIMEGLNVS